MNSNDSLDKEQIAAIWEKLREFNELEHSRHAQSEVEEKEEPIDDHRIQEIMQRLAHLEINGATDAETRVTALEQVVKQLE